MTDDYFTRANIVNQQTHDSLVALHADIHDEQTCFWCRRNRGAPRCQVEHTITPIEEWNVPALTVVCDLEPDHHGYHRSTYETSDGTASVSWPPLVRDLDA